MYQPIAIVWCLLVLMAPATVLARDIVTLVSEDDFAPYGYQSPTTGMAAGFSTEIIETAYASVGVTVQFKVMPYARAMLLTARGEEVGCFNTNNDEVSLREYYLTDEPLFVGEMVLWARDTQEGYMTVDQLIQSGEVVGVTLGYNYDAPGVYFDYNHHVRKDAAHRVVLTLRKLLKGRYRFAAAERRVADLIIAQNRAEFEGKIKVVGHISNPGLFVSFSRKHPDGKKYRDLLNQGLVNIKRNGEYARLQNRWDALIRSGVIP